MRRVRAFRASLALAVVLAAGCGLPEDLRRDAEALGARADALAERIDAEPARLESFLTESENRFLAPYAEREEWSAHLEAATREVERGRQGFTAEIAPLLDADDGDDAARLRDALPRVRAALDLAEEEVRAPARRAEFLRQVRDEAPERVAASAQALEESRAGLPAVEADADRAAVDYPEKADDLSGRLAALRTASSEATAAQERAEAELERVEREEADLAVLGDGAVAAAAGAAAIATQAETLRTRVGELYRSYSKTLIDMKQESKVEIGRTSWNESVDFAAEHEVRFEAPVTPEQLEALEALGDRPIATLSSFFGRMSVNLVVDRAVWDALRIDPLAGLPRGDNAAEFWVGDTSARYFHRYRVVENEQSEETDWVEVDEALFEQHYDDLGMDIVAKPYGSYEDEVLALAAPPGLAYVGNPKYGRWEEDDSGRRRWSWGQSYLFYYLLFGGPRHYYYYDDWRRWNGDYRGRRAWYGADDSYGTYGRRTRNSGKFAGGAFAAGGGFRRADRSVRGAGPAGRGGGPGGGGK